MYFSCSTVCLFQCGVLCYTTIGVANPPCQNANVVCNSLVPSRNMSICLLSSSIFLAGKHNLPSAYQINLMDSYNVVVV